LKKKGSTRLFFGWWTVFVTGIVSGLGSGFYGYGISVFFKDLASELGLTRAVTSVAAGVGRLEGGITSPLTGWLSDRYGSRWVIFTGICLVATGLVLMYFINSVGAYIVVWGLLIGVGFNIGLTIAVDKTLNDWFISKRGLAQGTKFSLIGVAGVVALPVVTWLVAAHGWRFTCLIWGCVMFVCAPIILIFVKQKRPEYYGLLPDGAKSDLGSGVDVSDLIDRGVEYASGFQETEFTFKQAIRTRAYWILSAGACFQMLVFGGINIHMIPFLTDIGIERTMAGGMMSLMVFFTIPARFLAGIMADRAGKGRLHFLLAFGFFLQTIGITTFLLSRSMASLYIFLILYGLSSGAGTPLFLLSFGRYFGRKSFGAIIGSSNAIRAPASLIAPVFAGWIHDTTDSYIIAYIIFAALSGIAMILMCLNKPTTIVNSQSSIL